ESETAARTEAEEHVKSYAALLAEAQEMIKALSEESVQAEARAQSERAARVQAEEKATSNARALSEAQEKLEAEIIKIANFSQKRAKCECCEREYPGENQLVRIDSGQMFCHDRLAQLKSAALS
ncbi:MAG: hypothetical protein ACYSWZ_25040, partial [Planctomycetota bacterium]